MPREGAFDPCRNYSACRIVLTQLKVVTMGNGSKQPERRQNSAEGGSRELRRGFFAPLAAGPLF